MGASPTPLSVELAAWLTAPVVAVAYSGGRDSTALLHAVLSAAQAQGRPTQIVALHVHHGLSLQADAWLAHVEQQCARWLAQGAPLLFQYARVLTQPQPGESIEAWARARRYEALGRLATAAGAPMVLLAHHRRDQAETFLLQALRGAAMAGLSAMPVHCQDAQGLQWVRPWLNIPRQAIEAYLGQHQLSYIDDDSNTQPRFARNQLRLTVWPALTAAVPGAELALVQSSHRAQEAQACLQDLAHIDLAQVAPDGPLCLAAWAQLPAHRRSNSLRAWLGRQVGLPVTRSLITRLLSELMQAQSPARWPVGGGELQRYRGLLSHGRSRLQPPGPPQAVQAPQRLIIDALGEIALPQWGGSLEIFALKSGGLAWGPGLVLTLRPRQGGEQFQAGPRQPARALKKHFQALRVPSWDRQGPLVYRDEALVFVPGLGMDARAWALGGEQVGLRWLSASGRVGFSPSSVATGGDLVDRAEDR